MKAFGFSLAAILLTASAAGAQSFIEDMERGVSDGREAGGQTSLLLPVIAGTGTSAALALSDGAELSNNHIVSAVVVNSALTVAATWVSSLILPPRPSREERAMLSDRSPEYAAQWENGYRESAARRRFVGKLLGSFGGIVLGIGIYAIRAR